jgi:DNA-binding MarR family transcriptional regulator
MSRTDLNDCPYYLISRASLAITSLLKAELAAADLGRVRPAYLGVLMSLWQEDGLRLAELGRRVALEPSTMTGLIDRMERDGLILRAADPEDRRAQRIRLTAAARQMEEAVLDLVDRALEQGLAGVSQAELASMKGSLRTILGNTERLP